MPARPGRARQLRSPGVWRERRADRGPRGARARRGRCVRRRSVAIVAGRAPVAAARASARSRSHAGASASCLVAGADPRSSAPARCRRCSSLARRRTPRAAPGRAGDAGAVGAAARRRGASRSRWPRSSRRSGSTTAAAEQRRGRAARARASRSSSLRRPTLFQVLGLLVAENGVYLLAVSVPGGLPFVVELGRAVRPGARDHRRRRLQPAGSTREFGTRRHRRCCGACVTDRRVAGRRRARGCRSPPPLLACSCRAPRPPTALNRRRRRADRGAGARPRRDRARRRAGEAAARRAGTSLDAAGGVFLGADRRRRARQRRGLAGLPAPRRPQLVQRRAARTPRTTPRFNLFWAALLALPLVDNLGAGLAARSRRRPPPRPCWSPSAASAARSRPAGSTSC